MRSVSKLLTAATTFAGIAMAQPTVNAGGIVNVASYAYAGTPAGNIARGSMVVIFGAGMGPATLVQATSFPLPTSAGLGGTKVSVTSGAVTADAILNYVSATQIAAIIPSTVPAGSATLRVTFNGQTSAAAPFTIVENSFGIFASNSGGSGPGIVASPSSVVYTPTNSAHPGDNVVIWGTGLGATTVNETVAPTGAIDMTSVPVEVFVNNIKANISYRGRSGCCSGIDQITFAVPQVSGCSAVVVVKIANVVSNTTTMPVAPTGTNTCTDPGGPSAADQQKFAAQGGASIGGVSLARITATIDLGVFGTQSINTDAGSATFNRYTTAQLNATDNPFRTTQALGTCTVQYTRGGATATSSVIPTSLDAGAQIGISPGGKSIVRTTISAGGVNTYTYATPGTGTDLTGFLTAGTYSATGSGGTNIGSFSTSTSVPGPVTSNVTSISSVNRASGQTFTWSGVPATSTVLIFGTSANGSAADSVGATFICTAKGSDGTFTVPAQVLLSLPPSLTVAGVPTGSIGLGSYGTPTLFTASGLDYGVFSSSTMNIKTLNIQ